MAKKVTVKSASAPRSGIQSAVSRGEHVAADRTHPKQRPSLRFRWKNFRGFIDTGWIELPLLTVVIGPNNAGKSSLLAPLLLLKQTLEAPRPPRLPLLTRGDLVNVGAYHDFVHQHDESKAVSLAVSFHGAEDPAVGAVTDSLPGGVEFEFNSRDKQCTLSRFEILDPYDRQFFVRKLSAAGTYSLEGPLAQQLEPTEEPADGPGESRKTRGMNVDRLTHDRIRNAKPMGLFFDESDIFHRTEQDLLDKRLLSFLPGMFFYLTVLSSVRREVKEMCAGLTYVGPFRDRSHRRYEHTEEAPSNVGSRGEFACEILARSPEAVAEVSAWVKRFGLADSLSAREVAGGIFEIELHSGSLRVNIADTGFGVSQLLPIIVQCVTQRTGILVVKQPELHLNPCQQVLLANLFVETSSNERRVCVETHSEHLLMALRTLIASKKLMARDAALYFVEKADGGSSVRRVTISDKGKIRSSDWPVGFMDEALAQALALAEAQSR